MEGKEEADHIPACYLPHVADQADQEFSPVMMIVGKR
jgi:hypothetical protein